MLNNKNNKDLFISVNTSFKLSDILTDFEFVIATDNFYNLIIEYKRYFARILIAVSLNDKFLVDNILRLLVEKLYRILTAIHNPQRGEKRIRRDSRNNMSNDLIEVLDVSVKAKIDKLYNDLSNLIHNTTSSPSDLYDIRRLFSTPSNMVRDTIIIIEILKQIFIDEVFLKLCLSKKELCGTNFNANIENNLLQADSMYIFSKIY